MSEKMTEFSQAMFHQAASGCLGVDEAVALLQREARIRTLRQKLQAAAGERELRPLLVDGLMQNHPEAKRDSVERKVRNWLKDDGQTIDKPTAIELCFVMGLDVEQSERFVASVAEESFHWRDAEEIVALFALKHGMTYAECAALREQMRKRMAVQPRAEQKPLAFTPVVRQELEAIDTVDELLNYLFDARERLGHFHNSAYQLFMDWMELLENPAPDDGLLELAPEERMSAKQMIELYLHRACLPQSGRDKRPAVGSAAGGRAAMSAVQRDVYMNWPDETALSRMKNRTIDVTRKVMILLFLATDGGVTEDMDDDEPDEPTRDELFQSAYLRLNQMLTYCGYSRLDPRTPFDWMTLYCVAVDDVTDVDAGMQAFLQTLFHTGNETQLSEGGAVIL